MKRPPRCRNCWFSGLQPKDGNPHGAMRWVCVVKDGPTSPVSHCTAYEPDAGVAPSRAVILAARARSTAA